VKSINSKNILILPLSLLWRLIMSQQIQELIEKIKSEGINAAENKGREREDAAKKQAQSIIDEAHQKAEQILKEAAEETKKMEKSSLMALKHASRDMMLSLRKNIIMTLGKIVAKDIGENLTTENLSGIIRDLASGVLKESNEEREVDITISDKDLEALKGDFLPKLAKEIKQPINFKSSQDIAKGFTISFDKGKSCFDFSDISLAEYVSKYLNTQVSEILKESVSQ